MDGAIVVKTSWIIIKTDIVIGLTSGKLCRKKNLFNNNNSTDVWQKTFPLSFYGSKMILDRPDHCVQVPIFLNGSNSFWLGPKHIRQVQIIWISQKNLILTWPKLFWPDQNDLDPTKQFVPIQNNLDGPKSF